MMARYEPYKIKKGVRWKFIIENGIDPRTGKRDRIVRGGFLKRKDAKAAAEPLEYKLGLSKIDLKRKISVDDFIDEWLNYYEQTQVKITTVRIRMHQSGFMKRYFGKMKLRDITNSKYQEFLFYLKRELKLADNTISGIHGTNRMIFKRAMQQHLIFNNPSDAVYIPKDKKTVDQLENESITERYLEKDELNEFLDAAKKYGRPEAYPIFFTLAWTGMRIGELLALKWKDIDFDKQTISITKTLYNLTGDVTKYILLTPKTKSSIRTIDIEQEVINVLKAHHKRQSELKLALGKVYHDEGFVFTKMRFSKYGYPMLENTIKRWMISLMKNHTKINKHMSPHGLRHTHTSLLAEAGVDITQIMDRLGHIDDSTTKRVYLHVTEKRKKEASHRFGEHMRSSHS